MSIYIPFDNHKDDIPVLNSEDVTVPHFTVGKVKKNKWEYIDGDFEFAEFRCSKCHKSVSEDYDDIAEFEFCPHCGAEMDNKEWEGAGRE